MPHLISIQFDNIGHSSSRLEDVVLKTSNNQDIPESTLIWLRNGGGKSTIISLIFAVLFPSINDFIGRNSGRKLSDYVKPNNIGTILTTWKLASGQHRIVGLAIKNNGEGSDLERLMFTFLDGKKAILTNTLDMFSNDDQSSQPILKDFPNKRGAGRAKTLKDIDQWLKNLRDQHLDREVYITKNMEEWRNHLNSKNFDMDSYSMMAQMNKREGGGETDSLFNFKDDIGFIDFLVKNLSDDKEVESLRMDLNTNRDAMKRRSFFKSKIDFGQKIEKHLQDLMEPKKQLDDLNEKFSFMNSNHQDVLSHLARLRYESEKKKNDKILEIQKYNDFIVESQKQITFQEGQLRSWNLAKEESHLKDILNQHNGLLNQHLEIKKWIALLELSDQYKSQQIKYVNYIHAVRLFEEQDTPYQEKLSRLKKTGQQYRISLRNFIENSQKELNDFISKNNTMLKNRDIVLTDKKHLEFQLGDIEKQLENLKDQKKLLEEKSVIWRENGILKISEEIPNAVQRLNEEIISLEKQIDDNQKSLQDIKENIVENKYALQSATRELKQFQSIVSQKDNELELLNEKIQWFSRHIAVVEFLEWEFDLSPDHDISNILNANKSKLEDRIHKNRHEKYRIQAIINKNQSIVEAIDSNNGLMPLLDYKEIIDRLSEENIKALGYADYLANNGFSGQDIEKYLREDPARYSGLVVLSKSDFDRIKALRWDDISTPIQITHSSAPDIQYDDGRIVLGVQIECFDQDACSAKRESLEKDNQDLSLLIKNLDEQIVKMQSYVDEVVLIHRTISSVSTQHHDLKSERDVLLQKEKDKKQEILDIEILSKTLGEKEVNLQEEILLLSNSLKSTKVNQQILKPYENFSTKQIDTDILNLVELSQKYVTDIGIKNDQLEELDQNMIHQSTEKTRLSSEIQINEKLYHTIEYYDEQKYDVVFTPIESLKAQYTEEEKELARITGNDVLKFKMEATKSQLKEAEDFFNQRQKAFQKDFQKISLEEIQQFQGGEFELSENKTKLSSLDKAIEKIVKVKNVLESDIQRHQEELKISGILKKNEFNLELIEENILAINKIVQEIKEEMKTYYSQKDDLEKQLVNINVILQSTSSLILPAYEEKIEDVTVQYQEVDIDILIDRNKRLTTEIKELEKEILKKSKDVNGQFSKFKNFINDDDWKNIDDNMMGNLKTIMSHESLDISDIERFVQQSQNIVTMAKSKLEMDDYHLNRLFERMQDYIFKISSSIRSLRQHSKFNDFQGLGKWSQTSFLEITLNMLDGQHQQIEIQKFLESELTNIELSDDRDMFKFLQRIFQNCCESSKINIMKPTLDDSVQKVKIKESVQWSGGEKLTTGLLLFMALVKARRSAKLQNNEKITLIQDNSIGTANLPRLVDLQIQMAKQAGIQLIYFTGLNDLDSLRRFPIIISVKNTQMQSRDGIASKESHIIVMDKQNDLSQSSMESQIELASIYKKEI